ncbi:MAG: hypothetical protein MRECE_56c003 [Mycoplasmataceae bacterium CE_OT135]|nr:MAG: hypothetical protein MRECE_56c003 [Mycoplasmataceae bacterium CE_OT135]
MLYPHAIVIFMLSSSWIGSSFQSTTLSLNQPFLSLRDFKTNL